MEGVFLKSGSNNITLHVAVLLQRFKIDNPWITEKWQAIGVIPTKENVEQTNEITLISNINNEPIYQYDGFILELVRDELDSYYQNLVSDNASIFVVCREDDDNRPNPFLVTLSYDEAAIYMETDETVYAMAIDIQIYQTIERFVLENYKPKKRKKRKLVKGTAGEHYQKMSVYE
ncbi:hypothetical protein BROOK1789B_1158 [Bathymodiolus brooksi thiotrophic gill symbiont]|nr:hypothetical protein BROOK1789B_1158 [Bathymodiolus brooksi thiotrophic gill symbiont]